MCYKLEIELIVPELEETVRRKEVEMYGILTQVKQEGGDVNVTGTLNPKALEVMDKEARS